jgi:hypothetical protein
MKSIKTSKLLQHFMAFYSTFRILLDARQKVDQIVSTINENPDMPEEDKAAQVVSE